MNLPTQQAGCWQVGSVVLGAPQKADPILSPEVADEVMTMMADSIVRLQFEADELRAEVALLREERNILARAKAAVTEGGTGYSGVERPEPPPHYFERRFREVHKANARIAGELRKAREAIRAVLAEKWLFDPQCAEDQALVDRLKEEALK